MSYQFCHRCNRPRSSCICKKDNGSGFGSFLTGALIGAAAVGVGMLFAKSVNDEMQNEQKPSARVRRANEREMPRDIHAGIRNVVCEKSDNESSQCHVCLDNKINCAFRPCNHARCCTDCALQLTECPTCREPVTEMYRIFL
eukprot:GDKJ01001112.1.p1 GENE.GDKJ01001112.1~~GDKJ01001112.1.p1  ORF type:complete len:142 (-),score=15.39 GDKJ01001112.1:25-450(-)